MADYVSAITRGSSILSGITSFFGRILGWFGNLDFFEKIILFCIVALSWYTYLGYKKALRQKYNMRRNHDVYS